MQSFKKVFFGLDLIFDYNSLLFSTIQTFLLSKNIQIKNKLTNVTCMKSPHNAMKSILFEINSQLTFNEIKQEWEIYFNRYLSSIKPQIGAIYACKSQKKKEY